MNFWSQFEQAACYPAKCQCEAARDALIRQPSAFWSSLAYILAGAFLYRYFKNKTQDLKFWAGVCVLMGLSSMFGHGSYIKFALAMDFASIILVLSFFALLNLLSLLKQSTLRIVFFFSVYYVLLFLAMYSMDKWPKIGLCVLIFFFSIGDVIRDSGWAFFKQKYLQYSLAILSFSFILFLMDEFHISCHPDSLFQWHSLWHVGTGAAMYYYGRWRFESLT